MSEGLRTKLKRHPVDTLVASEGRSLAVPCRSGTDRELDIGEVHTFVIGEHTATTHGAIRVCWRLVDPRRRTISTRPRRAKMRLPLHHLAEEFVVRDGARSPGCRATFA